MALQLLTAIHIALWLPADHETHIALWLLVAALMWVLLHTQQHAMSDQTVHNRAARLQLLSGQVA